MEDDETEENVFSRQKEAGNSEQRSCVCQWFYLFSMSAQKPGVVMDSC